MPRKNDPGQLRVGSGQRSPGKENIHLGPIVGTPATSGEVVPPEVTVDQIGDGSEPLRAHIHDPKAAHHATAIEINQPSPYYLYFTAQSVQGALDELGGLVPPLVPGVGNEVDYITISGIPDWGVLKLAEGPLSERFSSLFYQTENDPGESYPYYWFAPHPTGQRPPFDPASGGNDPMTDTFFNVEDGTYTGGGPGQTFSGAWTPDVGGPNPIKQTMRTMELVGPDHHVIVSGALCPADRGVLAIIYWPPGGTMVDFLALPLEERVLAAILLGQGLEVGNDDGAPGGIFTVGETTGHYDPFTFPAQATGQYNLVELHTGLSWGGSPLPILADDTAGVVRLGHDPLAGLPVVPGGGLPILGATTAAFNGGNDNNFFQYRLPYFSDYSEGTGLRYTPESEIDRYFDTPAISGGSLVQAGNYTDLEEDYWAFQLARYRHRFQMANLGVGSTREQGTYLFLHFKRELFFEDLVRDGIVPLDDRLYSANLVDWVDPENLDNIAATVNDPAAPSYHVIRGAVFEDIVALTPPSITTSTWSYTRIPDESVLISGVAYFLPMQSGTAAKSFQVDTLVFDGDNLFRNTYRVKDDLAFRMRHPDPLFFSLSGFSYSIDNTGFIEVPAGFLTDPSWQVRKQRIEFQMEDLGAYTEADGPLPADSYSVSLPPASTIDFAGDTASPAFTENAKLRAFFRRPVGHVHPSTTVMPTNGTTIPVVDTKNVMFHSTRYTNADAPEYGNFLDGGGQSLVSLETVLKDTQERFLDEVYRWHSQWLAVPNPDPRTQLVGPGLPLGPVPIDLPVRPNIALGGPFTIASWMLGLHFLGSLVSAAPSDLTTEAQVAGLPERNPPITDGLLDPFPSAGICMYPQKDYTAGYRPSFGDGDISGAQPDYSAAVGIREYVRAFDLAFSRSGDPELLVAGQPYFTLRVVGLKLEDFEYSGGLTPGKDIAILIKVPGLTTWLDAGRQEGVGPPKQDPVQDGAGCRVEGEGTFDSVEVESGLVQCDVRIYVGPTIDLFTNTFGEVPALVMVRFYDNLFARQFNLEQGSATGTAANIRGLVGLEIVRPIGVTA